MARWETEFKAMNRDCFIGVDLGQVVDPSALAVVERVETLGEWDAAQWAHRKRAELRVVYLERVALGTAYTAVAERVRDVTRQVRPCGVAVDATGLGRPVVEMLRPGLGCTLWPLVLTGGESGSEGAGSFRAPKRELMLGLRVVMERGELEVAAGLRWGRALVEEMEGVRSKRGKSGAVRVEGKGHDDLVVAVALGLWAAKRKWGRQVTGDVGWWQMAGVDS